MITSMYIILLIISPTSSHSILQLVHNAVMPLGNSRNVVSTTSSTTAAATTTNIAATTIAAPTTTAAITTTTTTTTAATSTTSTASTTTSTHTTITTTSETHSTQMVACYMEETISDYQASNNSLGCIVRFGNYEPLPWTCMQTNPLILSFTPDHVVTCHKEGYYKIELTALMSLNKFHHWVQVNKNQ